MVGLEGAFATGLDQVLNAVGLQKGDETLARRKGIRGRAENIAEYRTRVGIVLNRKISSLLGEGGKTVSDNDRRLAKEIGGLWATYLSDSVFGQGANISSLRTKVTELYKTIQNDERRAIAAMKQIESDVGRLIYRNGFQTNKNSVITQVLPINPNTVGAHSPSKYNFLDGCVTNDNYPDGPLGSGDPDPIDPDPVEEFGPCYGCVDNQITPQTGFTNSSNAGICGTVNGVTFYDDENHPQLEGCGAEGSFGTSGNYTVFDYPSGFDVTQWTASFIDMIINHPNPCNFLTQRITQFNNQLSAGVGPLQANQLMQKIAVCQELYQMVGCGGMNEQISGVKKYKLDPKAAAVIRRMAPKLRGLASKGRGVKKESKKISALKRIIKETLSELQEAPKKCKCKNGVCKTAGGTLCPAHECDNKCKGVEDTVDKKNK